MTQEHQGGGRGWSAARKGVWSRLRLTSLRLRLVVVFGLVALTAAVSASGIAYWLNRESVLTRTQDAVLRDFEKEMQNHAGALPEHPTQDELQRTAGQMANSSQRFTVLLVAENPEGQTVYGSSGGLNGFSLGDVPESLREAVTERQKITAGNKYPHHLYWQRIVEDDTPYLVAGTKLIGGGATGYMLKSLEPEAKDLGSLAWSLGIATGLALIGSALLAHAAATTVLKPVQRLGTAARRLGEGKLDTRLRVSGTDELADLSRTFNKAAEALEKRVADMAARDEASRRFVADMSHELRTPLTAITAVTEVLEEELEFEGGGIDPMIQPAVRLVVSETRRLNDLVENLMEVTRFDAGTARLVLDDVDVADQITACIDARAWLDAVELDAPRGIHARIDPRRLDVILANLIGNALKHGGSPVRVSVREEPGEGTEGVGAVGAVGAAEGAEGADETEAADPSDGTVVIQVRDHGPGIPEEVLPHVFDRFYKASASRPRSEGSGLGLSIALENAHIHGGEITAANSPEGGAVFTLRLPRDVSAAESGEKAGDAGTKGAGGDT
ncbi:MULTISPECIES: sensor histidine kinase [Streptomyces]|uniref:sensor histidine kinase n=1 Tax=Streptomyces TaxID=1883 RepID=UPI00142FF26A|nr:MULTISPECIES: HAMP domain-containing sensor histidine kinase [Streptomyces]MCX4568840.1 HAMP domain-containing histidine kinase [Streptomyces viridodiastaticus]MCX4622049.1 HAMP domain-containing histidine kinase [Streptomyces viridodiastaticus]NIL49410.1 HAMP domain-containing histidine kinase [Streptomyces sp. 2BBP-J2]